MTDLFPIEDYKQVSRIEIQPCKYPYFCVGFYTLRKWWKVFDPMFALPDNPDIQRFIKEKENTGWIMFICKLPEFEKPK